MNLSLGLNLLINGLSLSSTYALAAVGLTLVFGVLRILNFAHGELLMVGGYVLFILFERLNMPFFAVLVVAMIVVGILALALERGFFRLTRAVPFNGFIISLGFVYILQISALYFFGPTGKSTPTGIPGQVQVLGNIFTIQRIVIIPIIISVMALVWLLLERTKYGRAVRACIQDNEAASLQGMSIDRMSAMVMFLAGSIAGLSGALISQTVVVTPYMGNSVMLKCFIVMVVGGMGSVGGTVLAALLFGFLDSTVATILDPRTSVLIDIGVLLLILFIRPKGLFGRE